MQNHSKYRIHTQHTQSQKIIKQSRTKQLPITNSRSRASKLNLSKSVQKYQKLEQIIRLLRTTNHHGPNQKQIRKTSTNDRKKVKPSFKQQYKYIKYISYII
jgi:hypothetical protein